MIDRYTTQEKIHMKIFMSEVSVYNTHPDFKPDFRRKKCVLYAENYGTQEQQGQPCECSMHAFSKSRVFPKRRDVICQLHVT